MKFGLVVAIFPNLVANDYKSHVVVNGLVTFWLISTSVRMMFSKHGLWKFVDGSATLPNQKVATTDYNEKKMKAFALLCEHLTDAQLAHIQYCDNVKSAWEVLYGVHET